MLNEINLSINHEIRKYVLTNYTEILYYVFHYEQAFEKTTPREDVSHI